MAENRSRELHHINYLTSEMNALYHQASLKMGISDSVSMILYTLYDAGGSCPLHDICVASGMSKQTLNSALRGLEAKGFLYLEQHDGRSKRAVLTKSGMDYAKGTVGKLFQAEVDSFEGWPEDEMNAYVQLMEKHTICLRKQVEKM